MGFGTGLNCFINYLETRNSNLIIDYMGIEAYPVTIKEMEKLNYVVALKAENERQIFDAMHLFSWGDKRRLSEDFSMTKKKQFF